jgi:hypothetical protein
VKADIYKTTKYYNEGPRKLSILHTRLRYQCSSLNADLSKIHIINNFKCNCGASFEDAMHYFLECPLYLNERRTLLSNCDDININIETLLFGNDKYSYDVNSNIFHFFTFSLVLLTFFQCQNFKCLLSVFCFAVINSCV